ncbi:MAG: BrxA/BrxB family bacilliredoxin [Thermaerobacter sp.]|nr:BrxA/BrxB family bacilliredoxin [Bacillota bacterium]REJ36213.1 MAG: BrxA/BrxB family bacilliredoxin [Bacillota bacterium]
MDQELMDLFFRPMRQELVQYGFQELRTPEEVEEAMGDLSGTTLVVINSMCGCAGGIARPAVGMALQHSRRPDRLLTVFASQDREATARMRAYFPEYPPSSPSIFLFKDGQVVMAMHRSQIETRDAEAVRQDLVQAFDQFCA